MHNISNLFYFGTTLYTFRTVSPSIIRSLRLYIQHHTIQVVWLVLDSWWRMERPSETWRVLFQNKINLRYCASGWVCYRNILQSTILQTSKFQNDSPYESTSQNRVCTTWPTQHATVMSAANSGSIIIVHRRNMLHWQKLLFEREKAVTWTHLNMALCRHFELWNEDTVIPPNVRM
jgi:hypothetical protein